MTFVFSPTHKKLSFQLAFGFYIVMLIAGMVPGVRSEIGHFASGLVLHTLAYSVITFLLFAGLHGSATTRAIRVFLIVATMGALDEYIQSFFPYRHGSIHDWLVDVLAATGTLTLIVCVRGSYAVRRLIQ